MSGPHGSLFSIGSRLELSARKGIFERRDAVLECNQPFEEQAPFRVQEDALLVDHFAEETSPLGLGIGSSGALAPAAGLGGWTGLESDRPGPLTLGANAESWHYWCLGDRVTG